MAGIAVDEVVLAPVGLIGNDDDVAALGKRRVGIALLLGEELLDGGEHHTSRVNRELGAQIRPAYRLCRGLAQQILASGEGAKELVIQIVAVGQHDDGGVGHGPLADDAPGIKGHAQALTRALSMPDHADAPVARRATGLSARLLEDGFFFEPLVRLTQLGRAQGLGDCHLNRVKLMVTRHLLDQHAATVILVDAEIPDQRKESPGFANAFEQHLELGETHIVQRFARDRAPRLEPFPPSREGADASLHTVRDDQGRIHRE